jgi:heat-inducible transcriptional repressor
MAELEALGYLMQPHTSSGRIPSDAGYRIYVDQLMRPETLTTEEQRRIQDEFRAASRELDGVIEQTTRLLGQLSRNVAFAIAPQRNTQTFRHLQLIWLGEQTALAVIVTSLGAGTQRLFEHSGVADAEELTRVTNRLNARLGGKTLREISEIDIAAIVRENGAPEDLALAVQTALHNVGIAGDPLITSSGAQHLLDQPEFQDLRKLRSILRIIEEQKTLYDLVADSADGEKASVKIGQELALDDVTECSVVTVPYRMGDGVVGLLAILGPRRMNYGRLLALATGTAASLNDHLSNAEIR